MTLTLIWQREDGLATATPLPETGFYRIGPLCPDIFATVTPERSTLVVANGVVPGGGSPLSMAGTLSVTDGAGVVKVKAKQYTIRYGCGETFRIGKRLEWCAPDAFGGWWLRHLTGDGTLHATVADQLDGMSFALDDTPNTNPDASGSVRVFQVAWAGLLAACLNVDRDRARDDAIAFTDFQLRWRHALYYDPAGNLLRAHEYPWWRVGPKGWDGATKLLLDSSNGYPYAFESVQHLAPDIFLALAIGWDDPAARLYLDAYIEAILTRPEFRSGQLCDDQRSHGYCIRLAALWTLAGLDSPERDAALVRVVGGLRKAMGFAEPGHVPYPARNPPKTGKWPYGWPSLVDWTAYADTHDLELPETLAPPKAGETCDHLRPWLTATAKARKLPTSAYTDGPGGLWDALRAVSVFQTGGPLLGALTVLRDVPAAASLAPDIALLIRHVAACVLGPARADGIGPFGETIKANPIHYAYAALFPGRVQPWGYSGGQPITGLVKNGTVTWLIYPLLAALPSLGPAHAKAAKELAAAMWKANDYPSPHDIQATGLLPIALLGEIA